MFVTLETGQIDFLLRENVALNHCLWTSFLLLFLSCRASI